MNNRPNDSFVDRLAQILGLVILVLAVLTLFSSFDAQAESSCEAYKPLHTAYGLVGAHNTSMCTCSSCHLAGVWKGTPRTCNECHTGSRGPALGKNNGHIPTTAQCDVCHIGSVFVGGVVFHNGTTTPPGSCLTCHNGAYTSQGAKGKPSGHPVTTASCDNCHGTTTWDGARFSHTGVQPGTCKTCHNGTNAVGLPSGHILTGGLSCDVCHVRGYSTFSGGTYVHSGNEQCEGCHTTATKGTTVKPANHPATPNNCASCHSITGWPCRSGQIKTTLPRMYGFLII